MLYTLMNKHTPVVELNIDEDTGTILKIAQVIHLEYLPIGISIIKGLPDRKSLNDWWRGRSIPASRSGIREALDILNVAYTEQLLTKCYGLSLSDQYWINPKEHPFKWEDINFFHNSFSNDVGNALFGQASPGRELDLLSPCNTSDGWLRKKWKIIGGKRCLLKSGSNPFQQEPLNEVLATSLHQRLNHNAYVPYSLVWENEIPYSVCENFITPETELVNAYSIFKSEKKLNHHSLHEHFLLCCEHLGIPGMKEFLNYLLAFDFLIANTDRHFGNFGAVRNVDTLTWLGAAPIFDSGTSLWHEWVLLGNGPKSDFHCTLLQKDSASSFHSIHIVGTMLL
ncbi:MAG TPA: excisionase [Desulfosporosinus sp.]|nr:excisionase [Desulfosporosinus sp.]